MKEVIFVLLTHKSIKYDVVAKVAESSLYRIYTCKDAANREYLLQIAANVENNGDLDRAAYILKRLLQASNSFELEYAKQHPDKQLNYDRLFPKISNSFISSDQGNRQINILALKDIDDINLMLPLSNLRTRDKLRISLETSGWVMGRLLKLISFAHSQKISIRNLTGSNTLIVPEHHYVVAFDWTSAQFFKDNVPEEICKDDISNAAKAMFEAIGGDSVAGIYPYEEGNRYVKFLWKLACRNESDALKAHEQFYEIVYELYGQKFYPAKMIPL